MSLTEKVLIVGPSWVGDMVMAQSLYRELKRSRPQAELDVLAPAWSLPVLKRMPEVARGIELETGHGELGLAERWRLGRRLRREAYAQAIVLPRSLKAALVPYFARIPRRTGFLGEWRYGLINDVRPFDRDRLDQTVRRFVALGAASGSVEPTGVLSPALRSEPADETAARLQLDLARPLVALMPGAEYGPAKRWPAASFGELAARLVGAGCSVCVLGSARETELGAAVVERAGSRAAVNLCGATTLTEVIDLLAASRVAVGNDSGLLHVAAAVGTFVVALYGSSSPARTPPLTESKAVVYLGLECSPCFERTCPLGHLNCLRQITVDSVYDLVGPQLGAVH